MPNTLASIDDSAGTILVAEYSGLGAHIDLNDGGNFTLPTTAFTGHLQTCNFLFCDGHVKSLKPIVTVGASNNMWSGQSNDAPTAGIITAVTDWQNLVNKN